MPTAQAKDYNELMDMLDNVFFLEDESQRTFIALLPKLYKKEYRPWEHNYCLWEGGALKAAVGMYVSEVEIAGARLKMGGIGNVAVARDSRRKGYMKACMDEAMSAMKAAGCAFGELGGQRQRYQFWGFERCGCAVDAEFNEKNLRHAFGENELAPGWRAGKIEHGDKDALRQAQALIESAPLHVKHGPAAFYDILCSWNETPCGVWEGDALRAFFTVPSKEGKRVGSFLLQDEGCLEMALRCAWTALPEDTDKSASVTIPLWQRGFLALSEKIAESVCYGDTGMYTVLDWKETLGALFALQAQCKPLPDGGLTARIDGDWGTETLRLSVQGGVPCVEPFAGEPGFVFSHLEALRFFLAPVSAGRGRNALAQAWFPLPLWITGFDKV
jgi:GNAT superfamily N-acetyltransferase